MKWLFITLIIGLIMISGCTQTTQQDILKETNFNETDIENIKILNDRVNQKEKLIENDAQIQNVIQKVKPIQALKIIKPIQNLILDFGKTAFVEIGFKGSRFIVSLIPPSERKKLQAFFGLKDKKNLPIKISKTKLLKIGKTFTELSVFFAGTRAVSKGIKSFNSKRTKARQKAIQAQKR